MHVSWVGGPHDGQVLTLPDNATKYTVEIILSDLSVHARTWTIEIWHDRYVMDWYCPINNARYHWLTG